MHGLGDIVGQPIQSLAPPTNVIVAHLGRFENRLIDSQSRPIRAVFGKAHGHDGFMAANSAFILERIGENDAFRFDDLANQAALAIFDSLRRAHADMPHPADAEIHFAYMDRESVRSPPALEVLGTAP